MSLETWLLFVLVEALLCLTPGPAVLFVASTALGRGARHALNGAAGIVIANTLYFVLSALGVAAVILASATLFAALKWLGAAYLFWLGARTLHGATRAAARSEAADLRGAAQAPDASEPFVAAGPILRGFAVQAANPKALAFFVALVPQFIDPLAPIAIQIFILCVTSAGIEFGVLSLYTWLTTRARTLVGDRFVRALRGAAGAFLMAAGVRLAFSRSPP
jgi:homoserine/homoserine lactone efflux protein